MLRLASDENFNGVIVRNLRHRLPELDLVRVQDTAIVGAADEVVLEWAAKEGRILLTHDLRTIPRLFYQRLKNGGQIVPGIFAVPRRTGLSQLASDLALLVTCSFDGEWDNKIVFLPLS